MTSNERTAVLMMTHYWNACVRNQVAKLRADLDAQAFDVVLLYDNSSGNWARAVRALPLPVGVTVHRFTKKTVRDVYPLMQGRYNMSGKDQAAVFIVWAKQRLDKYRALWCIENDVRFSGKWSVLMDRYAADDTTDLLATIVSKQPERWHQAKQRRSRLREARNYRGRCIFMPIIRYTPAAIRMLDEAFRAGNTGHCELIQAFICATTPGCTMKSIDSSLVGRFVHRPVLSPHDYNERAAAAPNRLFHSVKCPRTWEFAPATRRGHGYGRARSGEGIGTTTTSKNSKVSKAKRARGEPPTARNVGTGATAASKNPKVSKAMRELGKQMLRARR